MKMDKRLPLVLLIPLLLAINASAQVNTPIFSVIIEDIPALDRMISNYGAVLPEAADSEVVVTAKTVPPVNNMEYEFEVVSSKPDLSEKGSFRNHRRLGNGRYQATYRAKREPTGERCATSDYLKPQTIRVRAKVGNQYSSNMGIQVLNRFYYLAHERNRKQAAIDYVAAKYGLSGATYTTEAPEDPGDRGVWSETRGSVNILGAAEVHDAAYSSENLAASTLIHEHKHVNQGTPRRIVAALSKVQYYGFGVAGCAYALLEIEAYGDELCRAIETCLCLVGEQPSIFNELNYYLDIEDEQECP